MEAQAEPGWEDAVALLAAAPERVHDLVAGIEPARLGYRHGPAFPTLDEILSHLVESARRLDAAFRQALLEGSTELNVRDALDAIAPAPDEPLSELLDSYARVRRRTVDLLRGLSPADLARTLHDPRSGQLTLREVADQMIRHELGHLSQIRNLISLPPETEDLGPLPTAAGSGLEDEA